MISPPRPDDPRGQGSSHPLRAQGCNRRLAAERERTGAFGNTGSSGRPYSAETAETAETACKLYCQGVSVFSRTALHAVCLCSTACLTRSIILYYDPTRCWDYVQNIVPCSLFVSDGGCVSR